MYDVLMACPSGFDAYAVHKLVYEKFAPPGNPREFLFTPVRTAEGTAAILARGCFDGIDIPPGSAQPVLTPVEGEVLAFTLRANPTVKFKNKPGQIGLDPAKDSLRLRWLTNRAAERGFELLEVAVVAEPMHVARPPTPFTLNIAIYSGLLRVTDGARFALALHSGIGRAEAWGCGLLAVRRP